MASLISGSDYTVSAVTITSKAGYLDTLTAGSYTLAVYYNPLGEEFSEGDALDTTTIALLVNPAPTTNGTGADNYAVEATVNITADTAPAGQPFDKHRNCYRITDIHGRQRRLYSTCYSKRKRRTIPISHDMRIYGRRTTPANTAPMAKNRGLCPAKT